MERIGEMQLSNAKTSAEALSAPLSSVDLVVRLATLMDQAQAALPNQTIPPDTADVWLKMWEEIVADHGLVRFEAALWKALRKATFFPLPAEIEQQAETIRESEKVPARNNFLDDWDKNKRLVEHQREEDRSKPGYVEFNLAEEVRRIEKQKAERKARAQAEADERMSRRKAEYAEHQERVAAGLRERGVPEATIHLEVYGKKTEVNQA